MITGGELYKVFSSMVPLFVAMGLGYASIKWWRMFNENNCNAINRFNCYFLMPFLTFQIASNVNPRKMNFGFLIGDVIGKAIVGVALVGWIALCKNPHSKKFSWAITIFTLSSFNNTLVVGVPLLNAMYGSLGQDLAIQSLVLQFLVWVPILLFLYEFQIAYSIDRTSSGHTGQSKNPIPQPKSQNAQDEIDQVGDQQQRIEKNDSIITVDHSESRRMTLPSNDFESTLKKVAIKLATNPNTFACALGLVWAIISNRWSISTPIIIDGSIRILGNAGSGVSMFTIGLFMGLQRKVVPCGLQLTFYSMVLRFVIGPLTMAIGSLAGGLRSDVLEIAIIQAALPQASSSFVLAKEYNLHADVVSASIIFGMIVSLPLLMGYYLILNAAHI